MRCLAHNITHTATNLSVSHAFVEYESQIQNISYLSPHIHRQTLDFVYNFPFYSIRDFSLFRSLVRSFGWRFDGSMCVCWPIRLFGFSYAFFFIKICNIFFWRCVQYTHLPHLLGGSRSMAYSLSYAFYTLIHSLIRCLPLITLCWARHRHHHHIFCNRIACASQYIRSNAIWIFEHVYSNMYSYEYKLYWFWKKNCPENISTKRVIYIQTKRM